MAEDLVVISGRVGEAIKLFAQDNVVQIDKQKVRNISRFDLSTTVDSIFIIKSLLTAIVKDCTPIAAEARIALSTLKQELLSIQKEDNISADDFFRANDQFYLFLYRVKGFERLTKIINKEKLHIDRILRLYILPRESYQPILRLHIDILDAIHSANLELASNAIAEWARAIECYVLKLKKYYPDSF